MDEVIDEYRMYSDQFVDMQADLQNEPIASMEIPVPGLGTYPMHAIANGLVFDYYCHLHHSCVAWGTKRRGWRRDCTVTGDEAGAARFLDALNIV